MSMDWYKVTMVLILFEICREEYSDHRVPRHPCLELEANCEQILNTHSSRRLVILKKAREPLVNI